MTTYNIISGIHVLKNQPSVLNNGSSNNLLSIFKYLK